MKLPESLTRSLPNASLVSSHLTTETDQMNNGEHGGCRWSSGEDAGLSYGERRVEEMRAAFFKQSAKKAASTSCSQDKVPAVTRRRRKFVSGKRQLECNDCSATFSSKATLLKHQKTVHCQNEELTPTHDHLAATLQDIKEEVKDEHGGESTDLEKSKEEPAETGVPRRRDRSGRKFPTAFLCDECGKQFKKKMYLVVHKKNCHVVPTDPSVRKFPCPGCPATFFAARFLSRHIVCHPELCSKRHLCELCGKSFVRQGSLRQHRFVHESERPFACKVCDAKFKSVKHLNDHAKKHEKVMNPEPYSCSLCGKEYRSLESYNMHQKLHKQENSFKCSTCRLSFPTSRSLNMHIYHGVCHKVVRTCQICDKTFYGDEKPCEHLPDAKKVKRSNQQRHKSGNHVCPMPNCTRAFIHRCKLQHHLSTFHSSVKRFKCTVCDKGFKTNPDLKLHMDIHNNVRYPCTVCGETFQRKTYLPIHMRRHTGEKPYVCPICGRGFGQKGDLNKHVEKIHNR